MRVKLTDPRGLRISDGVNQSAFWTKYGVTQSGGSRYEAGRPMPKQVAMLLWLVRTGRLSERDLKKALDEVEKQLG